MRQLYTSTLVLALTIAIGAIVIIENKHPPVDNSFETLFIMAGKPIKTLDRSFTKLIGVTVEDEKALGDLLANEFRTHALLDHPASPYLNRLMQDIADSYNPKGLNFRVFVVHGGPNAFALPGGVIGVTTGLLEILETEAELVAILGHEKGHIDLGHCIDMMRVEAKRGSTESSSFLSRYIKMLFNLNFSKTQETESDNYGFETTVSMDYDVYATSHAHDKLMKTYGTSTSSGILKDYFKTHPSSQIREENWRERATRWHNYHPLRAMYKGSQNFKQKKTRSEQDYPQEWNKD